jgi:hypothetical protein
MTHGRADVLRWMRGHRLASRRIARETRRSKLDLETVLGRIDDLRHFADDLGTTVDKGRAERENLAFHLAWRRVRRALGVG